MRRLTFAVAGCVLLASCVGGGAPLVEVEAPELVLDVTNATADEAVVGWTFDSEGHSGNGESLVSSCRRETLPVSSISGDYAISVDGKSVFEGAVPPRASADSFFVVRVTIGPDGDVEVDPPRVAQDAPDVTAAIPCG